MKKKGKILVAMSGGVDSSVAAALLVKAGYDVTGVFAVNYDTDTQIYADDADHADAKCWLPDYRDAVRVAAKLGIPLLKWDFTKEYKTKVLDYMYKEYEAGRTPNPDVLCNKFIKFGVWLERAKKEGFNKLATGHYAYLRQKIRNPKSEIRNKSKYPISNIQYQLRQARDTNKDQTYFLHQLSQPQLQHAMFPIGGYLKSEVRELARKFGLPTADKEESMGICFIGEVPMKKFLQTRITQKKGRITRSDGTVVGEHEGLAFYTIGQRHTGFKIEDLRFKNNRPMFVVDKDIKHNRLIVGYEDDPLLYKKQIRVIGVHWISGQAPKFPLKCQVRLRHRQELQIAECPDMKYGIPYRHRDRLQNKQLVIKFQKSQRAPTPGQFAVLYKNGKCLGGGIIM
jgi:tRNA-specific 2-thiouridylase